MRLLIPKATSEQARWQQVLNNTELDIDFVDPWCITQLPETPAMRSLWLNIDQFAAVVCISPSAAQAAIDALDDYWPMQPEGIQWFCNGPRTATILKQAAVKPIYPKQDFTAEAVLALPEARRLFGEKWLVVKGEGGRDVYRDELCAKQSNVSELVVYRRALNGGVTSNMIKNIHDYDALWLSSEYLGQHLLEYLDPVWQQWSGQWWVSSMRIAKWLQPKVTAPIRIFNGATPETLISALMANPLSVVVN